MRNEEEKGRRREKKGERESTEKMAHNVTCMVLFEKLGES